MLEALWSVEFISDLGVDGAGVVVFETERILGGDSQSFYVGSYKVTNGILDGQIEVTHYSGVPYSVFGPIKTFQMRASGKLQSPVMELSGYTVQSPNRRIAIRCTRRADLATFNDH